MRSLSTAVSILLMLATPAWAEPPAFAAGDLVGRWQGESEAMHPGSVVRWTVERSADGRYLVDYRVERDAILLRTSEERGVWQFENGVYVTHTEFIDGRAIDALSPRAHNRYDVLAFDATTMTYRHRDKGTQYTVHRIDVPSDPARVASGTSHEHAAVVEPAELSTGPDDAWIEPEDPDIEEDLPDVIEGDDGDAGAMSEPDTGHPLAARCVRASFVRLIRCGAPMPRQGAA